MASLINNRAIVLIMFFCLIGGFIGEIKIGNGQCTGDLQGLMTQCAAFVQKPGPIVDPTQACCNVIKTIDAECVCKHINKEAEQLVSMPKAMHCLQYCGKPLPHGAKCGRVSVCHDRIMQTKSMITTKDKGKGTSAQAPGYTVPKMEMEN